MHIPPLSYALFEVGALAIAVWLIVGAFKESRFLGMTVLAACVYGFFLEYLDIRHGHPYFYKQFALMVGPKPDWVPLCICLAWANLILTTLRAVEKWGIVWYMRPLMMALLALILDLVMDPVVSASRIVEHAGDLCDSDTFKPGATVGIGFWIWCVSPENKALWFGIPLANFFGWMVVIASFSLSLELVRRKWKPDERGLGAQLLCVLGVFAGAGIGSFAVVALYQTLVFKVGVSGWILMAAIGIPPLIGFVRALGRTPGDHRPDLRVLLVPGFNFVYCLCALVLAGVGSRMTASDLFGVLAYMVLGGLLFIWPFRRRLRG